MTITITEHSGLAVSNGAVGQCGVEPALAEQAIDTSAQSVTSQPFNRNTNYVRINVDSKSPVHLSFGTDPVATTRSRRLSPNQSEYFHVYAGHNHKLAVIEGTN